MLFNSYIFIFGFLPITFFVYMTLNRKRLTTASKVWLVFASLFFYSWWNIGYLPLILLSIGVNYLLSQKMLDYNGKQNGFWSKKRLFQLGLLFNIGLLGYFKYMDFFIGNINMLLGEDIPLLHLALPLGISFFTLQQVGFLVDSYEGLVEERNFLNYANFVTFFPQLISGPIVHHSELMPQFAAVKNKVLNYHNIAMGLFIFSMGLFKKVVIADTFGIWARAGFDTATTLNFFEAWATSLSYTFQIYFDFSGYMDMAIGAALLFNIKLPINFNSPYRATGMIDYWSRWHITLTNFITTYVYTPILRSFKRVTFTEAMWATFLAMLISGIWHGASWMFILWGVIHGIGLVVNHYWRKSKRKMHTVLAWFITFNFVNITMVVFRAKEWEDAVKVLGGMADLSQLHPINSLETAALAAAMLIVMLSKNTLEIIRTTPMNVYVAILTGILFSVGLAVLEVRKASEFLYFQF